VLRVGASKAAFEIYFSCRPLEKYFFTEKYFFIEKYFSWKSPFKSLENKSGMVVSSFYTYLKLFLAGLDLKTFKSS
jgi:hypothetical protein